MSLYAKGITASAALLTKPTKLPGASDVGPGRGTLALFWRILFMRSHIRALLVSLGLAFAALGLAVPVCQKLAIDDLVLVGEAGDISRPVMLFGLSFLALVGTRLIELLVRFFGLREGVVVEKWLSAELYKKSLSLDTRERSARTVGETVALMASHLNMVTFFLTELFPMFFTSAIPVIVAPFMLVFYFDLNPLPVFGVVLASLVAMLFFARAASRRFQRFKLADEVRLGAINEWLQSIKALKVLGWLSAFENRLQKHTRRTSEARIRVVTLSATMNTFSEAVPMLLNAVGIMTLIFTRPQEPTPGEVLGVLWVLAVFLAVPMRALPWVFVISMDAKASLQRIESYMTLPSEDRDSRHAGVRRAGSKSRSNVPKAMEVPAMAIKGLRVQLGNRQILRGIDLEMRQGSLLAIVGDVGAGKTTLLHALMGEVSASYERYELYGKDVAEMEVGERRSYFAYTPQDAFVFGASVRENVVFDFQPERSVDQAVSNSLELVAYGPDLAAFAEGVETQLGERGVNLSGGQKQRLALARAHFAERPIVLLDDTLSALDAETEKKIVERLVCGEWREKAILLVTHRLSVLPQADRIVYLRAGRVVASGTFDDLQANEEFLDFVRTMRPKEEVT